MKDTYHHGDLRNALINAGLKLINESGEENLSLRKVASLCNVSHSAPYAHFKDKEELIEAIKKSVTDTFMEELNSSIKCAKTAEESILNMGRSYVLFFKNNPDYYTFLFGKQNISAHMMFDKEYNNDYQPFILLKNQYLKYLDEKKINRTNEEKEIDLIKIWSTVQGLASICCMKNVNVSFNWEEKINSDLLLR